MTERDSPRIATGARPERPPSGSMTGPEPADRARDWRCDRRPAVDRIRRYVFTEARIDCKAWQHRFEAFCAVPAGSLEASRWLDRYSTDHERGHQMTSEVTDTPRPGQPPAASELA